MRLASAVWAVWALVLVAGCDLALVDADGTAPVAVRFQVEAAPDSALLPVLAVVESVRIGLSRGGVTVDTILPVPVGGEPLRLRVVFAPPPGDGALRVRADLDTRLGTVFTGEGLVTRGSVEWEGVVTLEPVPDRLTANPLSPSVDALGEPIAVTARLHFVTGDVIPGLRPRLSSSDASVADVVNDSTLISRGNGQATMTLSHGDLSRTGTVTVRQRFEDVLGITPGDTTVFVGDSVQFRFLALDRNGHPMLPGADVSWSAVGGAATIDSLGLAVAIAEGTAEIGVVNSGASRPTLTVLP